MRAKEFFKYQAPWTSLTVIFIVHKMCCNVKNWKKNKLISELCYGIFRENGTNSISHAQNDNIVVENCIFLLLDSRCSKCVCAYCDLCVGTFFVDAAFNRCARDASNTHLRLSCSHPTPKNNWHFFYFSCQF